MKLFSTVSASIFLSILLICFSLSTQAGEFAEKKVVLQISDADPSKQTLVLNVANNLLRAYGPDRVSVEIVAFGPGLRLLFNENSNKSRIKGLADNGVEFTACSNTRKKMSKLLGKPVVLNPVAKSDSPGVVRIANLVTDQGYILVKP